jgi:hypothetical protein
MKATCTDTSPRPASTEVGRALADVGAIRDAWLLLGPASVLEISTPDSVLLATGVAAT